MSEEEEYRTSRLLNQLVDGSIAAEDFAALREDLLESPELRQHYYDLLAVDRMLGERYELPDYISVQANTMNDTWSDRRSRKAKIFGSIGAAAAALVIAGFVFHFIRQAPRPIPIEASADSSYQIDGAPARAGGPVPGELLSIERGVVSAKLNPYIEACFEGPAQVRILDSHGNVELVEGNGYFEISPGGKDFKVHCRGHVIRDIGTKFGVKHGADGFVEVHVNAGSVEITGPDGSVEPVESGGAVRFGTATDLRKIPLDSAGFVRSLPWERIIFHDDFESEGETPVSGRQPKIGGRWLVFDESSKTLIRDGVLDTSFGRRHMGAGCNPADASDLSPAYLMTFETAVPANLEDKPGGDGAAEFITLTSNTGVPFCSVAARVSSGHEWCIVDEQTDSWTAGSGAYAFKRRWLTLLYESWSGKVVLYEGQSPDGREIAATRIGKGHKVGSIAIQNGGQGDLALEELTVKVVAYTGKK
ncbi:hypothetical protein HAHE_27600 [Haloferula helveola]|uniref:FecR protein domain-containing protein n=1 Tax=Haloferula helveola TaxID=490095 RepID=A0ABN6H5B4_9BACT|nr:hypothetical protein HAHE_27600 [Haloferula helveola]